MPYADFGENLDFSASRFRKLKGKGDKVIFRIIGRPYYDGKHFIKTESGWDIQPCTRINDGESCEYCNKYFKLMAQAKKDGLSKKDASELTKPYKPSVAFYYPILNRETHRFEVLQTTLGVRNKIETLIEMGTDILKKDLVLLRTEKPGSYYELATVDTIKLSDQEKKEIEEAKNKDLSEYVSGQLDEKSNVQNDVEF